MNREIYDFEELTLTAKSVKKGRRKASLTMTVTPKNGKRLSFSKGFKDCIGNPEFVQFSYKGNTLAVGEMLPNCGEVYKLMSETTRDTLYRVDLLESIQNFFELDFSERKTQTFDKISLDSYTNDDGVVTPIAIITMKEE